jgi:hypothetical protein
MVLLAVTPKTLLNSQKPKNVFKDVEFQTQDSGLLPRPNHGKYKNLIGWLSINIES